MTMSGGESFIPLPSDEYNMTNSETGDSPPAHQQSLSRSADYWFGKKYFECIIAQGIFETLGDEDTFEVADSKYEETLRNYPYQVAVNKLRSLNLEHLMHGSNDFVTLMTFLGMTVRVGESKDKRSILDIIRNCQNEANGDDAPKIKSQARTIKSEPLSFDDVPPMEEVNAPGLEFHTSRLKEIGDQEGWQPEYRSGRHDKDPNLFRTTVSFRGFTFEGLPARNSRYAKHSASKVACAFIDQQRDDRQRDDRRNFYA